MSSWGWMTTPELGQIHTDLQPRSLCTCSSRGTRAGDCFEEGALLHTPAIKSNLFCLAHSRLSRIRNSVKKKVRWPRKPTFREVAKQTSTCHFQDETEQLLNISQKMLCKQKIGFCLPALDFQFSLALGGCFFSSLSVCIDCCFHLNLLVYHAVRRQSDWRQ